MESSAVPAASPHTTRRGLAPFTYQLRPPEDSCQGAYLINAGKCITLQRYHTHPHTYSFSCLSQMRKLRLREGKRLAPNHKCQQVEELRLMLLLLVVALGTGDLKREILSR